MALVEVTSQRTPKLLNQMLGSQSASSLTSLSLRHGYSPLFSMKNFCLGFILCSFPSSVVSSPPWFSFPASPHLPDLFMLRRLCPVLRPLLFPPTPRVMSLSVMGLNAIYTQTPPRLVQPAQASLLALIRFAHPITSLSSPLVLVTANPLCLTLNSSFLP